MAGCAKKTDPWNGREWRKVIRRRAFAGWRGLRRTSVVAGFVNDTHLLVVSRDDHLERSHELRRYWFADRPPRPRGDISEHERPLDELSAFMGEVCLSKRLDLFDISLVVWSFEIQRW